MAELQPRNDGNGGAQGDSGLKSGEAAGGLKSLARSAKDEAEGEAIRQALEQTNWNRKQAAALLQISYKALLYKIRQYGIAEARATTSSPRGPRPALHFSTLHRNGLDRRLRAPPSG